MSICRNLFVFASLLPVLACAADPAALNLIMPDARVVVEVDVAKILASPIGQTIKTEMERSQPDWQKQIIGKLGFDVSKYVQDVLVAVATGNGKDASALVIVRGSWDRRLLDSLKGAGGKTAEYEGVPIINSNGGKGATGMIAMLDNSMAVIGEPADVQAAIHRWKEGVTLPPKIAAKLAPYSGHFDIWFTSLGPLPTVPSQVAKASAGKSDFWQQIEAFHGGIRFSPDFHLSAEIVARNEEAAATMKGGMEALAAMIQAKQKDKVTGMDNVNLQLDGKRILLSVHVPEDKLRQALQRMQTAPATPRAVAQAPAVRPPVDSDQPPPPAGMIRVQSSPHDMGTVLVPVAKQP